MGLSLSSICAGIIFGGVGLWLFREAKRKSRIDLFLISIALFIYPMFTPTPLYTWGVGFGLCVLARFLWFRL